MAMIDRMHEWTDSEIDGVRSKLDRAYSQAAKEMREKLDDFMASYERENEEWKKAVKSGKSTQKEYKSWLRDMASRRKWLRDMSDALAQDAARTNERAAGIINDTIPKVFSENAGYAAYGIERAIGKDTGAFTMYDEDTIRRLMRMDDDDQLIHEVIPYGPIHPDKELLQSLRVYPNNVKDVAWNRQKFTSAITQSILQGESIPNASKRLSEVLNMNKAMATRAARTAITSAENAGRVDSYKRAKDIGINLEQEWIATFDNRTRHSHRQLHGQHVPVGEKFEVDGVELEFPADPAAPPAYTYNCRCTLVAWFPDMPSDGSEMWTDWKDGTTYEDWKGQKAEKRDSGIPNDGNPETLAGVRRGAPMSFDEANEMRGNPNYNMAGDARDRLSAARRAYYDEIDRQTESSDFDTSKVDRLRREMQEAELAYRRARQDEYGYHVNCQTCVVANEARRRGYDVQATPNVTGSVNDSLSTHTNWAWIDPTTGEHPEYISYDGAGRTDPLGRPIPTYRRFVDWLEKEGTIEEGERYTIEFGWKGRTRSGHIVCLERTQDGLRMYDPQCGETYDQQGIRSYLRDVKYKSTIYGTTYANGPTLLKVSSYQFDMEICEQILTGGGE